MIHTINPSDHHKHNHQTRKGKTLVRASGSVLLAIIASSHHWLHTLLIALGLTTLGTGLFTMSPAVKSIFLLISLVFSIWFLKITKRKWKTDRPAAWVYLVSSIISIVLVSSAIPQTIASFTEKTVQVNQQQNFPIDHEKHHQ